MLAHLGVDLVAKSKIVHVGHHSGVSWPQLHHAGVRAVPVSARPPRSLKSCATAPPVADQGVSPDSRLRRLRVDVRAAVGQPKIMVRGSDARTSIPSSLIGMSVESGRNSSSSRQVQERHRPGAALICDLDGSSACCRSDQGVEPPQPAGAESRTGDLQAPHVAAKPVMERGVGVRFSFPRAACSARGPKVGRATGLPGCAGLRCGLRAPRTQGIRRVPGLAASAFAKNPPWLWTRRRPGHPGGRSPVRKARRGRGSCRR